MAIDLPENVVVSKLDELASWCRKNSLWPMPFATACCGIELMATGASRHDLARFGAEQIYVPSRECLVEEQSMPLFMRRFLGPAAVIETLRLSVAPLVP